MSYTGLEDSREGFWRRITLFLVVSCVLHALLVSLIHPMTSLRHLEKDEHRKPIFVDLMEHKEGLSPQPASLSPAVKTPSVIARRFPSEGVPLAPPHQPPLKEKSDKAFKKGIRNMEEGYVFRKKEETVPSEAIKPEKVAEVPPKTLPSVKDLIPSLRDLLSAQISEDKLHYAHFEQDGIGRLPAEVQYDAYLSTLKQRVVDRWNVSTVTDIRDGTTIVRFVVGRDGSLQSLQLTRSSGMVLRDHEAVAAIKGSFPLKPPPESLLDEDGVLHIQFTFHYIVHAPYSLDTWEAGNKRILY